MVLVGVLIAAGLKPSSGSPSDVTTDGSRVRRRLTAAALLVGVGTAAAVLALAILPQAMSAPDPLTGPNFSVWGAQVSADTGRALVSETTSVTQADVRMTRLQDDIWLASLHLKAADSHGQPLEVRVDGPGEAAACEKLAGVNRMELLDSCKKWASGLDADNRNGAALTKGWSRTNAGDYELWAQFYIQPDSNAWGMGLGGSTARLRLPTVSVPAFWKATESIPVSFDLRVDDAVDWEWSGLTPAEVQPANVTWNYQLEPLSGSSTSLVQGRNLKAQSDEQNRIFWAGVLAGIAGGALVGVIGEWGRGRSQ